MARGAFFKVRDDDRALRRLLLGAMALGFIALIVAIVATWTSTQRTREHNRQVEHTYRAIEMVNGLQVTLEQSETARRGYLLSGEQLFLDAYRTTSAQLLQQLEEVGAFTADNARQRRNVQRIRRRMARLSAERDRSIALVRADNLGSAYIEFRGGSSVIQVRAVRERLRAMVAEEQRLLVIRSGQQDRAATWFLAILTTAGLLVILVAAVSLATVLRYTRDLGASRDILRALNNSLEDQVAERTTDLTRANDEIQRFAYIVSHDLRSPLVNVMGFTAELEAANTALSELVDRAEAQAPDIITDEAREAARTDLPEAIGFIRASTEKMDRLINAILKLSRQGSRALTPERLDMAALVAGIRDTIQHRLDDKGAELAIETPLPEIVSDRLAIEQIFGNVIDNAVKYLDPARPGRIVVRGREERNRAIFEIEDNGRGIAASDHARVFDLFRRAGNQDQPGEGIGLAHVRALTYRLGGIIDVASQLGAGATFRITLPTELLPAGPST